MLILFPVLVYLLGVAILIGRARSDRITMLLLAETLLTAAVFCGAWITVSSEILSAFHALHRIGIVVAWLLPLLALGMYAWRNGSLGLAWGKIRSTPLPSGRFDRLTLGLLTGLLSVLFVVAWISPPNNVDSLLYHVSRVAHWAQNQDLEHYATAREHQLLKPIWAETAILHLRLLWGGDRPSNLVQWSSMLLSGIGVAGLAARLGVPQKGQWLAAAFAFTIPSGIVQSTSTQNDYAVALWSVCTAFYVLTAKQRELTRLELLALGLGLGLGFLTKGTFYVYAPPLMLWYFLPRLWTPGIRRVLAEGVALTVIATALNVGFWARNVQTYGGLYGSSEWLQRNLWIRFLPSSELSVPAPGPSSSQPGEEEPPDSLGIAVPDASSVSASQDSGESNVGWLTSWGDRVVRTAGFNLVTPSARINAAVLEGLEEFPRTFSAQYLAEWKSVAWSHEDTTPNSLGLGLAIVSIAAVLIAPRGENPWPRRYGLIVLAMFGLIPVVIGHGPTIWGMRYQLPFFVLVSPVVAAASGRIRRPWAGGFLGLGLILAALPWVLFNNTRPLIGRTPWPTRVESILTASPGELMFAINPKLRPSYEQAILHVEGRACREVGLRIDSDDLEYLFWWLLAAPESGVRVETVYVVRRLEPLLNREFHPCAIVCTICGDRTRLHGLPRVADLEWAEVFAGPGFTWDEDG